MAKSKKAPVVEDVDDDDLDIDIDLDDDDDAEDSENSETEEAEDEDDEDEVEEDELEALEDLEDDDEDEDEEEEVEEEAPKKKSKKAEKAEKVVVKDSKGKKLKATVEGKNLPAKKSDFDPDTNAAKVVSLCGELASHYVKVATEIGAILVLAKKHFKEGASYKAWLEKKCCLSYSTAQLYAQTIKMLPDETTKQKVIDLGMTSAHVKELVTLKKPELVEQVLNKATHSVPKFDSEGEKVGTEKITLANCDPKELRKVVKSVRGAAGVKERAEPSKQDQFTRFVSRTTKFMTDNWDAFREFGSAKLPFKPTELAKEEIAEIKQMIKIMDQVVAKYEKIKKNFQ